MKPEYFARLKAWVKEEVDALKAKGASGADLQEPVLWQLILKILFEKHRDEILVDSGFAQAVSLLMFDNLSPLTLRKMAAQDRQEGNTDSAYLLELIADRRERGAYLD
jgi:hypothetical protein